uniref:Uncharacterized protein n=1 Tax=Phaeodactylum tricornutum TaxID=2850 RepID=A0A8J9TBQ4_PHATR
MTRSHPARLLLLLSVFLWKSCSCVFALSTHRRLACSRPSSPRAAATYRNDLDDESLDIGSYIATCIPGLSDALSDELRTLGCQDVERSASSAVRFNANTQTALKALLWTRTSHKVMEFLCESPPTLKSREDLHRFILDAVPVKELLGDGRGGLLTLSVGVILNNPSKIPKDINHSHYSALTVKNALCDAVRELRDDRPSVDLDDPDVPLTAVLLGTDSGARVSLYRQLHNGSLHKRGYRSGAIHKAAMKESLAAGLLLTAGWDQKCRDARREDDAVVLLDPMAGSGSLLLEGAMMAVDLAPGLMRIKCGLPGHSMPPVVRWKHDGDMRVVDEWKALLLDATSRAKSGLRWMQSTDTVEILGNDIHDGALNLFENALDAAGLRRLVQLEEGDCSDWKPKPKREGTPFIVVSNPPWGVRLTEDMSESWESMRIFLRECCPSGTEAWVLSGNAEATKHLGLRRSQSLALKTGDQDLRWLQYILRDRSEILAEIEEKKSRRKDLNPYASKPAKRIQDTGRKNSSVPSKAKENFKQAERRRQAAIGNEWMID